METGAEKNYIKRGHRMKKKILCAALTAVMLTGCVSEDVTENSAEKTESVTVSLTETEFHETTASETEPEEKVVSETEAMTETTAETTAEIIAEITQTEAPVEIKAEGFVYRKPDKSYLSQLIKEADGKQICLAMYADGRVEQVGEDRIEILENRVYYKAIEEMVTEEYFAQLTAEEKELFGVSTYEEYKKFIKEQMFGGNIESEDIEPAVYFLFDGKTGYEDDESEDSFSKEEKDAHALRMAEYLFSKPEENPDIVKKMAAALNSGNDYFGHSYAEYTGNNILTCYYAFSGNYVMDEDSESISAYEKISADGSEGVILGNSFVPEDTEVLAISSRSESTAAWLAGEFIPEGCIIAAASDSDDRYYEEEDVVFDIAEINRKLPKLKELYMYQAVLENADKLPEMEKLETLSYYRIRPTSETDNFVETVNDSPFAGMDNLKELRLYGEYEDYSFLSEMKGLENAAVSLDGADKKQLDSVFACEFITELEIRGVQEGVKIDGIEKLKNLRILKIDGNYGLDVKNIGKLSKLEDLELTSRETAPNLAEITKLKNLKKLMLHSMEDEDLSFIGEMKSLEALSLYYVDSSFEKSIGELTNLRSLALMDINESYNTEFLDSLDKLEDLTVFDNYVDLKGASKAEKLKTIGVMLCSFHDLSELKKCGQLESLMIYNCTTPFDAEWIDGLKLKLLDFNGAEILNYECLKNLDKLENMSLYFCTLSQDEIDEIQEALPSCTIDVEF